MLVPRKPFQHSLIFVGKVRSIPKSWAPERCSIRVGSGLTRKHQTRLERFAKDKNWRNSIQHFENQDNDTKNNDNQHNDTQHNNIQNNDSQHNNK
jgi:hypothetical protein